MAIEAGWARKHFKVHDQTLHKVAKYRRVPGDPPHPLGLSHNAMALRVPEFDELVKTINSIHHEYGHATVGTVT